MTKAASGAKKARGGEKWAVSQIFRIRPTPGQAKELNGLAGASRVVQNRCIEYNETRSRNGEARVPFKVPGTSPHRGKDLSALTSKLRKAPEHASFHFLEGYSLEILRGGARRASRAYQAYWDESRPNAGLPEFKGRSRDASFEMPIDGLENGKIRILGSSKNRKGFWVRVCPRRGGGSDYFGALPRGKKRHGPLDMPGAPKSAVIKRAGGKWFACIQYIFESAPESGDARKDGAHYFAPPSHCGNMAGIDRGVVVAAAVEDDKGVQTAHRKPEALDFLLTKKKRHQSVQSACEQTVLRREVGWDGRGDTRKKAEKDFSDKRKKKKEATLRLAGWDGADDKKYAAAVRVRQMQMLGWCNDGRDARKYAELLDKALAAGAQNDYSPLEEDADGIKNPKKKARAIRNLRRNARRKYERIVNAEAWHPHRYNCRHAVAKARVCKWAAKESQKADDWMHHVSAEVARRHSQVAIENLSVAQITKKGKGKRGLNRNILQRRWGKMGQYVDYKLKLRGGELIKVSAYNSSRECARCRTADESNRKLRDVFCCRNPKCEMHGVEQHADFQACRVLMKRAIEKKEADGELSKASGAAGIRRGKREIGRNRASEGNPPVQSTVFSGSESADTQRERDCL